MSTDSCSNCEKLKEEIAKLVEDYAERDAKLNRLYEAEVQENASARSQLAAEKAARERAEARVMECLEEDAAGRSVPELLRLSAAVISGGIHNGGGGPLEDCLKILADRFDAILAASDTVLLKERLAAANARADQAEAECGKFEAESEQKGADLAACEGWLKEAEKKERMVDAAISVLAMSNTRDTLKGNKLPRENPYWTPAQDDVEKAIMREIDHREARERAEKALAHSRWRTHAYNPSACTGCEGAEAILANREKEQSNG